MPDSLVELGKKQNRHWNYCCSLQDITMKALNNICTYSYLLYQTYYYRVIYGVILSVSSLLNVQVKEGCTTHQICWKESLLSPSGTGSVVQMATATFNVFSECDADFTWPCSSAVIPPSCPPRPHCPALCFLSTSSPTFLTPYLSIRSPHATTAYFLSSLALLQTSCASTRSSTMKTCRRSPSTSWSATSTPRDSRLERHSCHRGTKHTQAHKKIQSQWPDNTS